VCPEFAARQLASKAEMSGYLVGSAAFKAVGTGDPRPAGSIPVHLRQEVHERPLVCFESSTRWGYSKFDPRTFGAVCSPLLAHLSGRGGRWAGPHSSAFAPETHRTTPQRARVVSSGPPAKEHWHTEPICSKMKMWHEVGL
jgi:hypothetical protein